MINSRDQIERGAPMAEEFRRVGVRLAKTGIRFQQIIEIGKSDDPKAARMSAGLEAFLNRCDELGIRFLFQPGSHYAQIEEPNNLDGPFYEGLRRIQSYYKGRIHYWSLGNEVNGGGYSRFTQDQYAQVTRNMSMALKSADPEVQMAPGELYSNGGYLTKLAQPEYRDFWSVLTVHKVVGVRGTPCAGVAHYKAGMRGLDRPVWDTEVACGCIHGGPSAEGFPVNMRSWFPHEGYDDEHGGLDKSVVRTFCLETRNGARWMPGYYNPEGPVLGADMFLGYHYNGSGHTLWALRKRYTPLGRDQEVTEGGQRVQQGTGQEDAQNHKVAGWRTVCDMLYGATPLTRIPNLDVKDPYAAKPDDKYVTVDGYIYRYGPEYVVYLWQNLGSHDGDRKVALATDPEDHVVMYDSFGNAYPLKNEGGVVKVWVPMNMFYLRGFTRLPKFALDDSDDAEPYFVTEPVTRAVVGKPYWYNAWAYDPDVPARENNSLARIRYELVSGPAGMTSAVNTEHRTYPSRVCLLNWTPTKPGRFDVKIRAFSRHGQAGQAEQSFTVTVLPADAKPKPIIRSQPVTPFAAVGAVWRYNVRARDPGAPGQALSYSLTKAPEGMKIDPAAGFIQWTPKKAGRYEAEVSVANASGEAATQAISLQAE